MKKQNITNQITIPNNDLENLKKFFPHCFDKNGCLDFEKLKTQLSESNLDFSKESYGMDWLGKSYARLLATDPATTLLKEDTEWNNKQENKDSENLLIKGDNLEVLKHLSNAYYNKIKMIYIDPPYNTGTDGFVYEDDRKFTVKEFSELAGVDDEKAKKILSFVNSKSNSHSAWLTFMYPRLYIAKQLLKDDGVIFVSIDDSESFQLKALLDEIFGEDNFIATLVWQKKKGGSNDSKYVALEHEYIFLFTKSKSSLANFYIPHDEQYLRRYNQEDEVGKFYWDTFKRKSGKQYYPITSPDGTVLEYDNKGNKISWLRSQKTFLEDLKSGEIKFEKNNQTWSLFFKQRLPPGKKPRSVMTEVGTTSTGSDELLNIFGKDIFDNPKPSTLIKHLLLFNSSEKEIILDFFSGSGTTADAVLQLNYEKKGNNNARFILVQLPELINPNKNQITANAYDFIKNELNITSPTIFDITKERIIRAANKIKSEIKDPAHLDLGFKIFETTPIWENYNFDDKEYTEQTNLFDEATLTEEDLQTLLTTWKVYDNIPLTVSLSKIQLNGYNGYYANNKLYLMHKGFTIKHLTELLEKIDSDISFTPSKIIVFGFNFESKTLRELAENVASYANKKGLDIDLITRY